MKVGGYAIVTDPSAPDQEFDTITCAHDQRVVFLKRDPGGWCLKCMKAICGPCADRGVCTPFEKALEAFEKRDMRKRHLFAAAGLL